MRQGRTVAKNNTGFWSGLVFGTSTVLADVKHHWTIDRIERALVCCKKRKSYLAVVAINARSTWVKVKCYFRIFKNRANLF